MPTTSSFGRSLMPRTPREARPIERTSCSSNRIVMPSRVPRMMWSLARGQHDADHGVVRIEVDRDHAGGARIAVLAQAGLLDEAVLGRHDQLVGTCGPRLSSPRSLSRSC